MSRLYVIDTTRATAGPWRETLNGKYAIVRMSDGRVFHVAVVRDRLVRIPYKPRGQNRGWTYMGSVNDANGRCIAECQVAGSIGVRGMLKIAGLVPEPEVTR